MANTKTGHRCKQQPQQRKFNPLAGTCVDGLRNQFCGYFKETKMQLIMEFPKKNNQLTGLPEANVLAQVTAEQKGGKGVCNILAVL